ncbi:MAG TPA: RES family NAD+ phosphorylase [Tichowtungia sp.]|nr:RES family NAD+ phosphorylase [Tichowtungia sp.]
MRIAWRIVKPCHVEGAFSGEGARLFGGRWNSVGTPMVYVAESRALAALELLVHLDHGTVLDDYLCIPIRFSEKLLRALDTTQLRSDWRSHPPPRYVQILGDQWVKNQVSVVLEISSALIPGERNYLLNPRHPDFGRIEIGAPEPFEFDPRVLKK